MSDDVPTIGRADRAEMLRDRRIWYMRTFPNPGTLLLADQGGLHVAFEADAGRSWSAPIEEVTCLGRPDNGPPFLAQRSIRLLVDGRRMIICFSGSEAGSESELVDLQVSRLTGDFDPITSSLAAIKAVRSLGPVLRTSKDAADVWTDIFAAVEQDHGGEITQATT
jgi:hypothetical protein